MASNLGLRAPGKGRRLSRQLIGLQTSILIGTVQSQVLCSSISPPNGALFGMTVVGLGYRTEALQACRWRPSHATSMQSLMRLSLTVFRCLEFLAGLRPR